MTSFSGGTKLITMTKLGSPPDGGGGGGAGGRGITDGGGGAALAMGLAINQCSILEAGVSHLWPSIYISSD